jgi:hypothetical protein
LVAQIQSNPKLQGIERTQPIPESIPGNKVFRAPVVKHRDSKNVHGACGHVCLEMVRYACGFRLV